MSFERHETPDEDDFYTSLVRTPQNVSIVDVGKLYDVEDNETQKYFYIKYKLCSTAQEQSVAYNVKYVNGTIIAPEGSKLFPLLSFVSGIEDGEIHCKKQDIDDALNGKTFYMKAKKQKGKRAWYKIIPLSRIKAGGVKSAD